MTPYGQYISLAKRLKNYAQTGTLKTFQEFLRGPFRPMLAEIAPDKIESALNLAAQTKAACESRTRLPAKPKPIPRKGKKAPGIDWHGNPALRARLASLYAKHGPLGHKAVAADMRLTVGQVRLAKRRHLDSAATSTIAQAA